MHRDNEQIPIPQTFCGALQKEVNCKCLVLSVLIYGCLAAVTWCKCAITTKIVTDFTPHPIRSEIHVSPCDDGYIYIPVAFMGMLYLVYLVECYHSPVRIDLLHAESQNRVMAKLTQLKLAQPTIWWKAISYHYVRRKRQITRYRNGDNYTTTQVYYERVNTHAATSFYIYDYCGVKDISKDLILDPKIPITKITLTKGFAFSNVRSATEFEESRSRFFAEQEFRDDYMEMREGLDLGYNFNPVTLVAVLGNPWFTNSYVYWCLSALLLSWPLRLIIEYKTQYVDYQITKLFGINYDSPTTTQIHTSASQLSAPGSYMLAPSYSEALLMDSNGPTINVTDPQTENNLAECEMVPSYSEALLYECAHGLQQSNRNSTLPSINTHQDINYYNYVSGACKCPCHATKANSKSEEYLTLQNTKGIKDRNNSTCDINGEKIVDRYHTPYESDDRRAIYLNFCRNCLNHAMHATRNFDTIQLNNDSVDGERIETTKELNALHSNHQILFSQRQLHETRGIITRDFSEPDLRSRSKISDISAQTQCTNGRSLENILENDEASIVSLRARSERSEALILDDSREMPNINKGAIPKHYETRNRAAVNPISEAMKRIPTSKTYFCLKSILKHNRRRYTLVTTDEFQNLARGQGTDQYCNACKNLDELPGVSTECSCLNFQDIGQYRNKKEQMFQKDVPELFKKIIGKDACLSNNKSETPRTLLFANPIQEICSSDPFGGKRLIASTNLLCPPNYEEALNLPVLSSVKRPFMERNELPSLKSHSEIHQRGTNADPTICLRINDLNDSKPTDDSVTVIHNDTVPFNQPVRNLTAPNLPTTSTDTSTVVEPPPNLNTSNGCRKASQLMQCLKGQLYLSEPHNPNRELYRNIDSIYRLSDGKRANFNMETSL